MGAPGWGSKLCCGSQSSAGSVVVGPLGAIVVVEMAPLGSGWSDACMARSDGVEHALIPMPVPSTSARASATRFTGVPSSDGTGGTCFLTD